MRTIKRSNCAILHLVLRRTWFDLIASGEKRVEFREAKHYWNVRISNWCCRMADKTPVLEFRNGYGAHSPRMAFIAGNGRLVYDHSRASDPVQHPALGEFPGPRYCLFIGERVKLED